MSKSQLFIFAVVLLLLAGSLSACSAPSTPRQIAAYPQSTPIPRPFPSLAYDSYLELEVSNVNEAVEEAIDLTYRFGGLLIESRSWEQQGAKHAILILASPTAHSEALRSDLLELGTSLQEQVSIRTTGRTGGSPNAWTYFTIHLQSRNKALPVYLTNGWRPIHTLEEAWSVFISIFGFLLDILIWITVVIGPFTLIGLLIWIIARRFRSRHVRRM